MHPAPSWRLATERSSAFNYQLRMRLNLRLDAQNLSVDTLSAGWFPVLPVQPPVCEMVRRHDCCAGPQGLSAHQDLHRPGHPVSTCGWSCKLLMPAVEGSGGCQQRVQSCNCLHDSWSRCKHTGSSSSGAAAAFSSQRMQRIQSGPSRTVKARHRVRVLPYQVAWFASACP